MEITSANKRLAVQGTDGLGKLLSRSFSLKLASRLAKLNRAGSGYSRSTAEGYPQLLFFRIHGCAVVSRPTLI